jgi:hypothetical protein
MKATQQDNESLIQEALRDAKKAEIPSDLKTNPIIHRGDSTLEAPMTVKEISGSGYVYVWDTRSYEKIPILYYMLPSKLRLRRQDGSFMFTTTDPGKEPKHGEIKCMLNSDYKDRKHFDELGFRVCPKSNLTNQYQLETHMKRKHPQEWATIKSEKETREREEDRALQRLLLKNQIKEDSEVSPPLYIKDKK